MPIQVKVPTVLRKHTDGAKRVTGEGATLAELLDDLDARHEGLRDAVLDEDGQLRRYVNVFINDEDVRYLEGIKTGLADGDTVAILPAVAGGG